MNTELTQLVPITETQIFNWKELTSTTMKQLEVDMSQELSSWISNQELWTVLELDLSDNSSDQTTSFLVKLEQEITGQRGIILKEPNSSCQITQVEWYDREYSHKPFGLRLDEIYQEGLARFRELNDG